MIGWARATDIDLGQASRLTVDIWKALMRARCGCRFGRF